MSRFDEKLDANGHNSIERQSIVLFVHSPPTPPSSSSPLSSLLLCWSAPSAFPTPSSVLPLRSVVQLSPSRDVGLFRSLLIKAPVERCLCIVAPSACLYLECGGRQQRELLLTSLHCLLTHQGKTANAEAAPARPSPSSVSQPSTPTVGGLTAPPPPSTPSPLPHPSPSSASREVLPLPGSAAEARPVESSAPVQPQPLPSQSPASALTSPASASSPVVSDFKAAVHRLSAGDRFTLWAQEEEGQLSSRAVFLRFEAASGDETPGLLHWSDVDGGVAGGGPGRLLLNSTKRMTVGCPLSAHIPAVRCLSITAGQGLTLHLEAASREVRDAWQRSLHLLLTRNGLQAVEAAKRGTPQPKEPVRRPSLKTAPPLSPSTAQRRQPTTPAGRAEPTSQSVEAAAVVSPPTSASALNPAASPATPPAEGGASEDATTSSAAEVALHSPLALTPPLPQPPSSDSPQLPPPPLTPPPEVMQEPPAASACASPSTAPPSVPSPPSSEAATPSPLPPAPSAAASLPSIAAGSRALPSDGGGGELGRTIQFCDPTDFFHIQAKVGEGSYGSVYRAVDVRDGSLVAIKVLPFDGRHDSRASLKLRKEIHILQRCESAFIVGYKGAYQKGSSVWVAMEYAGGGSLSDVMQACGHTFSERQIACIMRMALQGLAALHRVGIIHRDVKVHTHTHTHTHTLAQPFSPSAVVLTRVLFVVSCRGAGRQHLGGRERPV